MKWAEIKREHPDKFILIDDKDAFSEMLEKESAYATTKIVTLLQ